MEEAADPLSIQGQSFSAVTPNGSTFSVAPVDSFGFLGNEGALSLTDAGAFTVAPASLGLDGRDVTITGSQIGVSALTLVAAGTAPSVPTAGVDATADTLTAAGSTIVNRSGDLAVTARVITLTQGASLATTSAGTGMAGDIGLTTSYLTLGGGATISSSAAAGAAGDITLTMPDEVGILLLDNRGSPSAITTFSNSSMGGMIVMSNPHAVTSNGGAVRALGQSGGASVLIASDYFIASADRMNQIAVDGAFHLDSNIYDVSNGTAVPSVAFLDASRVLSGQCASARSSGETSRLAVRAVGPLLGAPADPGTAPAGSGCR